MIFISHRGNLSGPEPDNENNPNKISEVLSRCYDAEIDVRYKNGEFWLGHDFAQYQINEEFLETIGLWCHAKDILTFERLLKNSKIHCFYHETDPATLTSQGFIWTCPGNTLTKKSIAVMPEVVNNSWHKLYKCYGICSDNIIFHEKNYYTGI